MRIDLHTHSSVSDGTDTPAELVAAAARGGLAVIALTDHDTFAGLDEAQAAGRREGVQVLRGVELSTQLGGSSVHLLGYAPDERDPDLGREMTEIRDGRTGRVDRMIERLNRAGVPVTREEVLEQAGDSPSIGRPHFADAMIAIGAVRDRTEAFDRFLGEGRPGYVGRHAVDLAAGIELIRGAGGVAVIAHPWSRGRAGDLPEEVIRRLVEDHGLDGLEVDHQDHDRATREQLRRVVDRLGILGTGSSDYHGTGKTDHDLGCNTTDPMVFDELQRRIADRRGAVGQPTS